MQRPFDAYIGIDWSGARNSGYSGIAIARCSAGCAAPQLVAPPARRWTRRAVHDWLLAQLSQTQRLLIGMDFAFALPAPFAEPPQLWAEIDAHCIADEDYWGGAYAEADSRFWHRGTQPADWIEHRRPAELACCEAGCGRPETPLKLIGPKQVGKGALAGMRVLHALRSKWPQRMMVWPFDGLPGGPFERRSVFVEIYPRLFIRRAGHGDRKLRKPADLDAALQRLGSEPARLTKFDDHEADALISAAGLREVAADAATWRAGLGQTRGWIYGVPPDSRRSLLMCSAATKSLA